MTTKMKRTEICAAMLVFCLLAVPAFAGVPTGTYAIRTANGRYLTAVNGGGVAGPDSIHTDATKVQGWEQFKIVPLGNDQYAIQTQRGTYLTAVNGGGVPGANAIHSDATKVQGWEQFKIVPLGNDRYAIQTQRGNYLTAVNGGGVPGADAIHSDATQIQGWEQFTLVPIGGAPVDCIACAAAKCPACANAIILLCIASGGPGVDIAACQACLDGNCKP